MTDTITPASLRAHADHMERVHLDGISAKEMRQEAARLEAESARDEEAERVGKAALQRWVEVSGSGEVATFADVHREVGAAAIAALAADGRLLPESGELTEAVKASLTDALDTVLSAAGVSLPVPDSGPDGTPEKPWPTWQDVPEGVRYWGRNRLYRWVNRDGRRMFLPLSGGEVWSSRNEPEMQRLAPFARVDGDQA